MLQSFTQRLLVCFTVLLTIAHKLLNKVQPAEKKTALRESAFRIDWTSFINRSPEMVGPRNTAMH